MFPAIATFTILSVAGLAPPRIDPARFGWYSDYSAAKAEARRTGKPIFLVFRCEP